MEPVRVVAQKCSKCGAPAVLSIEARRVDTGEVLSVEGACSRCLAKVKGDREMLRALDMAADAMERAVLESVPAGKRGN